MCTFQPGNFTGWGSEEVNVDFIDLRRLYTARRPRTDDDRYDDDDDDDADDSSLTSVRVSPAPADAYGTAALMRQ